MVLILGFEDYLQPSIELAEQLNLPYATVQIHRFPDGESKVTLPIELPQTVIICRSLHQPNEKLLELVLVTETARKMGVQKIILVAPYLCYMRQDIAFQPGEAISIKIVGKLLADYFDAVITVDPHLHRISTLDEAIPLTQAISINSAEAMAEFIQKRLKDPVIIGPDEESEQWVTAIAKPRHWDYVVGIKKRFCDNQVSVTLDDYSLHNQPLVIIDDIASTGQTLIETAKILFEQNPASISVIVTHAFFVNQSLQQLADLGITNVWSSDTVPHITNAFSIVPLIAKSLKKILP